MNQSQTGKSARQRRNAACKAVDLLAAADYDIGYAARLLGDVGLGEWQLRADALMRDCVALREDIRGHLP